MNKTFILTAAVTSTLLLSGCATVAGPMVGGLIGNQQQQSQETAGTDKKRVAKSAGIGCALGAVGAYMLGRKDDALAGCAAGAVIGGVASYRKQLNEARAVEAAAKDAGWSAQVKTREIEADDGKTEAFDGLVINYDPASMSNPTAKTMATLDRLAKLLDASKDSVTVRFEGSDTSCLLPRAYLDNQGALKRHTVEERCKGASRIVITPVPQI
jgi:outer membrane murein-binding lipoprotein Lpp